MDRLATMFKFTYISRQNVKNDWGVSFTSYHNHGKGVLNDVVTGKYDLRLSPWFWKSERNG